MTFQEIQEKIRSSPTADYLVAVATILGKLIGGTIVLLMIFYGIDSFVRDKLDKQFKAGDIWVWQTHSNPFLASYVTNRVLEVKEGYVLWQNMVVTDGSRFTDSVSKFLELGINPHKITKPETTTLEVIR